MTTRRIVFVCHTAAGESLRSARAIAKLDNVEMCLVTGVHDTQQLIDAARAYGNVHKIVTTHETLLLPVAEANEALGLVAMSSDTVKRTLDKSRLKATLKRAGVSTPRAQIVTTLADAQRFADEVGFPIVIKPSAGSGALTTFQAHNEAQLANVFDLLPRPLIAETFIRGQELCFDTITIDNEPQFYSICEYNPSIINALRDPERQWQCVMPREIDDKHREFIAQGLAAVRALEVGNAMTHMEGFIDANGDAWFTDATLRPAGARIAPMLAFAYDIDPYHAWARVAVDGSFDGPWERKYAVGTIFLRGVGAGTVQRVEGIERVQREFKDLLVDARWPRLEARKSVTYTGDGFVTVRHRETDAVHDALLEIARLVDITYSSGSQPATETWGSRLQNFRELNRPAWDQAN